MARVEIGTVYAIVHDERKYVYVGRTIQGLRTRIRNHFDLLGKGSHHCIRFRRAWQETGGHGWRIETLETLALPRSEITATLAEREAFWHEEWAARGHDNLSARRNITHPASPGAHIRVSLAEFCSDPECYIAKARYGRRVVVFDGEQDVVVITQPSKD